MKKHELQQIINCISKFEISEKNPGLIRSGIMVFYCPATELSKSLFTDIFSFEFYKLIHFRIIIP